MMAERTTTTDDQQKQVQDQDKDDMQHQQQHEEEVQPLCIPRAGEAATILFGSTPTQIFDIINEKIDSALRDGVATLPFLDNGTGGAGSSDRRRSSVRLSSGGVAPDEKLLSILREAYGKNLDLAEVYAGRNVFALPVGTGPKRREEVVTAYLATINGGTAAGKENSGANPNDAAGDDEDTNAATNAANATAIPKKPTYQIPPSKDSVPTSAQIASIEEETNALRRKLRAARRIRSDLRSIVMEMGQTHAVAKCAKRTLDESCVGDDADGNGGMKIQNSVAAAVAGREDLSALTEAGTDLIAKLDEEKEARTKKGDDDDDDDVVDLHEGALAAAAAAASAKPLTIEEDMERRRKMMRTGEKGEGLAKVSALLRER